jgi:hypothetical protein
MPKPTSKSRQELRSRFVRNAIPTEADFADLIAASLNQADDGVLKLPDQPLGLVRQKPDQPVLRFFADPAAEGSVWQVQLGSGDKPGFGLAAADGKLALFVDGATGNVGIGVGAKKPEAALHIAGNLKVEAGSITLDKDQKVFFTDNGQISSRDQYHQLLFRSTENITELREWGDLWFSAGANKDNTNQPKMIVKANGLVGIGTTTPTAKLQITGNVSIASAEGQNFACKNNFMAAGSLTIGGIDRDYGGGTSWNKSTAGLLLETLDNTEIAIHDSGLRLASFMYYEGANNRFTIGRDMGWGAISTVNVQGGLQVNGQTNILTGSNPIRFSSVWTAFPDDKTNGAEICNDTDRHKTLMIVGNNSKGEGRRVGIWDRLDVFGWCDVMGLLVARNGVDAYGRCNVTGLLHVNGPATKEDENKPQLEVYAPDSGDFSSYTKIRFHQGNQYWGWLGYHGLSKNDNGEFVFWNQNQSKVARIRCGDLAAKGAVVRSIWAGSGNGPTEVGDMGRLHSRTIRINKLFPETALRIVYCDNFRVNGDNVACRWEIRVDGNSVNPPILADRYESSGNRHLHGTVMGYARGVAAGAREIQVWIVPHPHNQGRATDVETGWSASTWSLEAEEVWLA